MARQRPRQPWPPLVMALLFHVIMSNLRAVLGWGLIAAAIRRRGSGASKHTQTFTSRSLLLTLLFRWLPWKCTGLPALSPRVRCCQAAPELNNTLKPFPWGWLKHSSFLPALLPQLRPVPPSRLELQKASPIFTEFS